MQNAGSLLEGGGQILRNAAALAALTNTSVTIQNIRAKRSKPGLRPQHMTGLQLIAHISNGSLEDGCIGATEVTLIPGHLEATEATGDTGTAGSCMLLAQSALPCLLFAPPKPGGVATSLLHLKGGTDAAMAPTEGYFQHVLLPVLRKTLHISADITLRKRGFFPKVR